MHALSEPISHPMATEIHSDAEAHMSRLISYDDSGVVLSRSPAQTDIGSHLWIELAVNGAPFRALGRVVRCTAEELHVNFKHLWPQDKTRWISFVGAASA
jgi:hypothetical protein